MDITSLSSVPTAAVAHGQVTPPVGISSIRLQICKEIIDISSSSSLSLPSLPSSSVTDRLDTMLEEYVSSYHEDGKDDMDENDGDGDGITPLMVACDRNCVPCLEWILETIERAVSLSATTGTSDGSNVMGGTRLDLILNIIGTPLDQSHVDRNTAAHHAAMANSVKAMEVLSKIVTLISSSSSTKNTSSTDVEGDVDDDDDDDSHGVGTARRTKKKFVPMLVLGNARNANNDTPLMMAAAADGGNTCDPRNASRNTSTPFDFIQGWVCAVLLPEEHHYQDTSSCAIDDTVGMTAIENKIRTALQATNDSGDSCLTLACINGHEDLVRYLLGLPPTQVLLQSSSRYNKLNSCSTDNSKMCLRLPVKLFGEDVIRCRASIQRRIHALERLTHDVQKHFEFQKTKALTCLEILERELSRQSEKAIQELMNECDKSYELSTKTDIAGDFTYKKKNKKKSKKNAAKRCSDPTSKIQVEDDAERHKEQDETSTENVELLITRQEDGKIAVRAPSRDIRTEETATWNVFQTSTKRQPQSLDSLLRDRVKSISTNCTIMQSDSSVDDTDVDSFMSALCLTPKSLLLSQHGMALDLSPAQLDAVQAILEQQIHSVKMAREIQKRRVAIMKTNGAEEAISADVKE